MASTYTPIQTTTLGSAQASYTFSSIPSTYTDVILVVQGTLGTTGTQGACIRVNGDTATNYSCTQLDGDGTSAASYRETSTTYLNIGVLAGTRQGNSIFQFQNYANTTTYKTILARGNDGGGYVRAAVGLWRSTASINSITLMNPGSATYQAGTTLTLYGITAA